MNLLRGMVQLYMYKCKEAGTSARSFSEFLARVAYIVSLLKILCLIELQFFFLLKLAAAKWCACVRIAVHEVAKTGEHFTSEYTYSFDNYNNRLCFIVLLLYFYD